MATPLELAQLTQQLAAMFAGDSEPNAAVLDIFKTLNGAEQKLVMAKANTDAKISVGGAATGNAIKLGEAKVEQAEQLGEGAAARKIKMGREASIVRLVEQREKLKLKRSNEIEGQLVANIDQAKVLHAKGLLPRTEVESAVEQLRTVRPDKGESARRVFLAEDRAKQLGHQMETLSPRAKTLQFLAGPSKFVARKPAPSPTIDFARLIKQVEGADIMGPTIKLRGDKRLKKAGIAGAVGLPVGAWIASKIFGGKDENQMTPEILQQLMLAQRAQQGDGGGNTSKTLIDMQRLLGIIKTLKDASGMQQMAGQLQPQAF
jgi:hypothetical protein